MLSVCAFRTVILFSSSPALTTIFKRCHKSLQPHSQPASIQFTKDAFGLFIINSFCWTPYMIVSLHLTAWSCTIMWRVQHELLITNTKPPDSQGTGLLFSSDLHTSHTNNKDLLFPAQVLCSQPAQINPNCPNGIPKLKTNQHKYKCPQMLNCEFLLHLNIVIALIVTELIISKT